jgi:hypothetical protein
LLSLVLADAVHLDGGDGLDFIGQLRVDDDVHGVVVGESYVDFSHLFEAFLFVSDANFSFICNFDLTLPIIALMLIIVKLLLPRLHECLHSFPDSVASQTVHSELGYNRLLIVGQHV